MNRYIVLVDAQFTSVGIEDVRPERSDIYIDEYADVSLGVFEANDREDAILKAKSEWLYDISIMKAYELK